MSGSRPPYDREAVDSLLRDVQGHLLAEMRQAIDVERGLAAILGADATAPCRESFAGRASSPTTAMDGRMVADTLPHADAPASKSAPCRIAQVGQHLHASPAGSASVAFYLLAAIALDEDLDRTGEIAQLLRIKVSDDEARTRQTVQTLAAVQSRGAKGVGREHARLVASAHAHGVQHVRTLADAGAVLRRLRWPAVMTADGAHDLASNLIAGLAHATALVSIVDQVVGLWEPQTCQPWLPSTSIDQVHRALREDLAEYAAHMRATARPRHLHEVYRHLEDLFADEVAANRRERPSIALAVPR
ncbi:hypothetical protein ACFQY4_26570 [Catellatospora bangladeshensis]|uniref:Uncharacterized protein n=1 Tax=Catellatospora bangladeshensis TaxID=310355 RepID=A0A8J3NNA5_9ACTN|nr:hypothetical protein [Catellatospora bangladeshensis]GIF85873.1 hypothetical protein Cba03nite_72220 [Catellatospora bangladeshensis]